MNKTKLLEFIARAHRNTYAAPKEIRLQHKCSVSILPGHKDHEFKEGDLYYRDSYAGSAWAPGREIVFFQEVPIWSMAYQGHPNSNYKEDFFQERAFPFLKTALMNFNNDMPYRGPKEFSEGEFKYTFEIQGDYDYFLGRETVFYKGEIVFFKMLWVH